MKLNLQKLSYHKIGQIAAEFLAKYHLSLSLPVPIEEIAEAKLNLKIIPVKTLKRDFDVDGCLDSSLSKIYIDFDLYIQHENRTRFTIAHEIGHLVLHQKVFEKLAINNQNDLYKLADNISSDDYGWLEFQAYSFAGQVLVPKEKLVKEIKTKIILGTNKSITAEELFPIFQELTEAFNVSGEVLLRRLQKEGLVINSRF